MDEKTMMDGFGQMLDAVDGDVRKLTRVNDREPAKEAENGAVANGGYGLVIFRSEGLCNASYPEHLGQIGYFDDEQWLPHDDEQWRTMSTDQKGSIDDAGKLSDWGMAHAAVYFGDMLEVPPIYVPHDWLRPATPEECFAHVMATHNPPPAGQS